MSEELDGSANLQATIDRYNAAWNAHDVDAIMSMHAPDMVFENHTAGETATGADVRMHVAAIPFENGLIKRKDVYSDSVSILRQVGFLD